MDDSPLQLLVLPVAVVLEPLVGKGGRTARGATLRCTAPELLAAQLAKLLDDPCPCVAVSQANGCLLCPPPPSVAQPIAAVMVTRLHPNSHVMHVLETPIPSVG